MVHALPKEKRTIWWLLVLEAQRQFGCTHTKSESNFSVELPPSDRVKRVHPNTVLVFHTMEKYRDSVTEIAAHS